MPVQDRKPNEKEPIDPQQAAEGPTLVVGFDFSPSAHQALEEAVTYCSLIPNCRLHVAWAPMALLSEHDLDPRSPGSAAASLNQAVQRRLKQTRPASPSGLSTELHLLDGFAGEAITRLAALLEADAIIVGHTPDKEMEPQLGSVAADIFHRASCPVWVAHSAEESETMPPPTTRSEPINDARREATSYLKRGEARFPLSMSR